MIGSSFSTAFADVERVGGGLLDDAERDRAAAVEADVDAVVERPELGARDVAQADRIAAVLAQDDVLELLRGPEVGLADHGELARRALDPAGRDLDVLPLKRGLDVLRRQAVGGQTRGVQPDAHGIAPLAEDAHVRDAGQVLQPVLDEAVGEIGDLEGRVAIGREGEVEDRLGVGLDLRDHRLVDLVGQQGAHPADPVAHVVGGGIGVAVEPEADRDLALLLPADRAHVVDALDAGQRLLQNLGDLALDDVGRRALEGGIDRDHGLVDLGVLAHREAAVGDQADQGDDQRHHGREHRPPDREIGQDQGLRPPPWAPA